MNRWTIRSERERIRIALGEHDGREAVYLAVARLDEAGSWRPEQGFHFPVEALPDFARALDCALAVADARGLVTEWGEE